MDYEKAYKEALERARVCREKGFSDGESLEDIFPELKESEDERIRKAIIRLLQNGGYMEPQDKEKAFAWLEKQKEPHYTKRNQLFDECVAKCDPEVMKEVLDNVDRMLEQKPAEWSEEDDLYLVDATAACIAAYGAESSTAKWLKSLCRRLCWKPTKEEMEALGYAVIGDFGKIQPTSYLSRRLEELEEELNNL